MSSSGDLSKRIANLSPEKRAELLKKMAAQKQVAGAANRASFPLRDRSRPAELSFAQQRLWFMDQLAPGSPLYNVPVAVRLEGALDVAVLERSLREVVRRHEALRTTFQGGERGPVQHFADAPVLKLERTDVSALAPEARDAEAWRRVREGALRPFDLATGPLMRAVLVKLADADHLLLVAMHHIVSDGWSLGVLVREVAVLYATFLQGQPSPLPELAVQYADYAAWQRETLQGATLEKQLAYWRGQLSGAPPALELTTDKPRPAARGFRGARTPIQWSRELTDALRALAQQEGATLFMVLLAGWQSLLSRYSGQDDVSVGSPMAGRTRSELEGLIGMFVNTLVLRARFTPELSFRGLLRQVRETMVGATDHQDLPFERLVEALQPDRDSGRTPFFQVMFALQNAPRGPVAVQGLKLNAMEVDTRTAKFDLLLQLTEADGSLSGYVEYDTDLFHAATVARMVEHLRGLLEAAVAHPGRPVARLPMLGSAEQRLLAEDWNRTQAAYPRERPVHALFAEQARKTPDRAAVVQGADGRTLTYGELDAKANRLAHHLRELGVKRGTRVGVYVERSLEMVVGLLAILKAGGAYVPVDRNYPAERIALLLEDAGVGVTLTQQALVEKLPAGAGAPLCVDTVWSEVTRHPETAPDVEVGGLDLAYIIFTSGSTGRPKGVCVPHQGITRLVVGNDFMRFGPDAVWSQTGPVAFDASTLELWGALLHGARLVLAPPHALTLEELGGLVKKERVSTLWLTTALYEQMALHQADALAGVTQVLTGGDVMPAQRAREHLKRLPEGAVLVNAYGPTENTTFSTTYPMTGRTALDAAVPIGKPIGNSTAYVLDTHGAAAGVGVPGELYVGGEGLAWGYLNRADLTAERFVPNAFSTQPGARLYRTGDKARWKEDGTLEFLGRTDFQVKVRGFRIELGEIEAALIQHPDVAEAAVVVRGLDGDKRLVGYGVPKPGRTLDVAELRGHLRQRLPEYMVPAVVVVLDALPLNANGKVDRKALPEPEAPRSEKVHEAPRTETEAKLADIWAQVLRVPQVGVKDHFFELGGHSLLATQVASRIRAVFGVELPLRELFESATLEALALRLERATRSAVPPLVPVSREQSLPLSFAQQRLWFIDQLEPGSALYNVPLAVRLEGRLDVAVLQRALDELVRRHEALRTTFTAHEGTPAQVVNPPSAMPLEVEDLRGLEAGLREDEARRRVMAQGQRPFDLLRGPLVRAQLVTLDAQDHLLALTMHHAISDGWSLGVLVREMGALYSAFVQGQPSSLPELPLQYADYAAWQRGWLQGDALEREVAFWKGRLEGAPAALDLPTDRPRPAMRGNAGAMHFFQWSPSMTQRLRALAQREGASLYMVLLAGWQVLLSRYSGQQDISVGSPIAGRTRAELEGLIGFFVNTLVLRAQVDAEAPFRELLKQVRGTVLEAYEHQDVPFEKLVEALQPERSLSHTPLFQTLLALQNVPQGDLGLPGMTLKPVMMESRTAKFDLSVFFVEEGEGLRGTLEYSTELFDATTVSRMVEHLRVLLDAALTRPEQAVSRLPMVDAEERQRILDGGNRMSAEAPNTSPVHVLFAEQARKTPGAVALKAQDGRTLTYGELDAKANQLAHHLRSQGVKRGTRVGVFVERSLEMVAGLLAILKAGGAYVPVDRNYPAERIALLLGDAGVEVTLTQRSLVEKLPTSAGRALTLDTAWSELARQPETAPEGEVSAEDLAYVMFTSGSTGRPKGVSVPHRGITRLVVGNGFLRFGPEEVWLQLAPVAFDASTLELWGALLHGAKLVLAPPHALTLEELGALLKQERISTLWLTAALYEQMALHQVEALAGVSQVLAGGDVLPAPRVREHLKHLPEGAVLVNGYGPTENTTFSTTYTLTRDSSLTASVPIGKPIGNSTAYVLDARGDVAGVGVPGELFVGGAGLAWGYLNRADLTAERFVPNAFSTQPGARLYRTGDKARWKEDGTLEFLGRTDFQVKVRGFRIELGEVEAALLRQEGVAEATVIVREVGGDKRLIAWLVAKPGQNIDPKAVELELRHRLPEYMVPSAMGVLDALPLTANGKVDRKVLAALDAHEAETAYEAPRTEAERKLAAIWAEVLRVPRVGVKDNFFSLGGHSLLATQVVSRIRAELGVELSLRVLFEAPVLEVLAERLGTATRPLPAALEPIARDEAPPLSFAQQRLWFIDQLEPGSALYNVPVAVRLQGILQRGALVRALNEVVRRHESLRTTFEPHEGQAVQRIHPHARLPLADVDLEGFTREQREQEVRRRLGLELAEPFDLNKGPLIRASLLRLESTEHVLLITMHHIVSDGWSLGVLIREVGALYAAFAEGRPSPLPELSLQYAGYAAWQRGWLQGETLQKEVDFWKGKLAGAPPVLELPTDRPRPAVRGNAGAVHSFLLPSSLAQALRVLAHREGASLYMVLLAGWQALLSRYSGQTDISVGSPIAGRTRAELEGLIGFFVNTLVLRAQVDGEASFRELLKQVRGTVLEAYEHQEVPFEKLVEALQPERSLSHTPLFQTMLALQNTPDGEARLPGLTMRPLELELRTSKFDVSVYFTETPQGLSGSVEYSTDLFEAGTVRRMVEHLRVLLEGVVAKPEEAVGRLPLLTEAERQQVLVTWNQSEVEYARDATIPRLFEAQAKRTPEAVAVVSGKQRLTYREVEAKANQLAHRLRKLGVGPESRVGLCVERTADVVVGTLGILKAGGAYVPLDPSYPKERLGWLLEDAQGPALVAHSHLLESLPRFSAQAVCLDTDATLAMEPKEAPEAGLRPENVAYLIYTSGSTGRPKGVAVTHRNAAAFLAWATETFAEEETKAVLAATSLNFDLSVFELFAPLVRGGSVVVVRNALHLAEEKPEAEVTLINTVPSAMAQLVRLGAVPPSVQVINLAGEALPETLAKAVYAVPTVKKLYNLYGPSEDTTYSTWSLVGRAEVPNIGRPLTNTRAYVLDRYLQPVPVGVAGELYLAGEGQARGYLLRPELTAEKFLPEVYGPAGSRMYRTGDRVRYRADGVLEYLGRVDFQVKVRGFRIELGEVESALRQQEAVKEAVVVAKGEGAEKRLVAYVAPKAGATLEAEALKASLRQRLPEYMVPGAVVVLEALPLNSNGKVDRKALPEPEAPKAGSTYEAPRTETEAKLAAIWAEVLRVPRVGVKDDFFALGGHSLLATQVVSRVRAETGAELPLRALFEARTVELLARQLEKAASSNMTTLARRQGNAARPLSFAQQRLWFIDQLEPGTALYNMPVAVRLEGTLRHDILERALREVVRRHETLRTTFAEQDGQPIQVIHSDMALRLERVELSEGDALQREELARQWIEQEMLKPFELSRGPLLRALLLKVGDSEHVLVVTMHHIVSDGWSLGVFVREVGALYAAFAEGRPSPLPELPVQYADYAAWQRDGLQGATLQREVDYWKRKLTGAPPVLELPTDHPRPPVRGSAGATLGFHWPRALAQALRELGKREGASLYMVLLAGWQVLLSRYSGQEDISVGSPIAGRTRAEVEGLIGFFVNTLVLRARVAGGAAFGALLNQVRETVLEAQEHQQIPFEKLVEALQPERDRRHTPLFQAFLALQNLPESETRLPGLTLKPVAYEGRTSKFDLSLFFMETPDGLTAAVEYSTDLFEAQTVRRMVEHLRVLLEGVVAKPEEAVGRLPLLTESERQQVLVTWNQPEAEYARDATIPRLFEAQAKRTPEAVAVVSGKQRLTYREVEAKANQLAHRLRKLGVGPESRVGLCVERTADVVVGTLGILKAGGAYVPLDPSYPKERLGWLLEDAQGPALVAHSHLLESLPPFSAQAVCLDREEEWAEESCCPLTSEVRPENVAYLIYTSGSTGRPKGVAVTHRNAVAFLAWATEMFTEEETKAVLAATSLNFDLSVFELFAPLVRGGSVVVVRNALHLAEEKPDAEVTLINTVPSAMAQLVRLNAVPPSVRVVNLAGEALPETLAKAVYAVPTVKKLYNLYGPSEDTTYSTWSLVGRAEVPNIGRPLTNTRAYVLDKYLQPVPVGVAGELYLAGEGQARGYLLRPELTAEKFLPEVYGPAGSRMYRTGDRVRYRADGVLEYLGRVDFQVKVRGFRIELGEVEAALRQQEAVKEAVVVAKGEGAEKRLVAYVAPKAGKTLESEALRASLRQRLPEYMVPGAVVVLEALPLNSNGKVDRKALPEPEAPASTRTYEAPRTETEAKLAAIWTEVLRVPRVGVKDDFFALGGHSLLVTQVVSRIRAETGAELPLRALFDAPTLEALARRLENANRVQGAHLNDTHVGTQPPLSFAQQRLWFIDQLEPGTALYNLPVAVRLEGALDVAALERALNEVVRRHDSLRTTFEERAGHAIQVIHPTLSLELGRMDLRAVDAAHREAEAHRQVEQEMLRPFDLGRGPLIRTRLLTLGDREHVLVVTMHHIVSDGWSLSVLIREVGALYAAFTSGQPSPLPELPVQYTRFAAWQRGRLQGDVLARQVDYWKQKLAGAPPVLELPTDRPRPAERGIAGAVHAFTLSPRLAEGLGALAQREGASLYMVLLAGWQVLMARYSGQTDISVGSPIAGRTRAELEGLIGFFVNTLVLRANVEGRLSFRELLAQVRETVLDAYEHQEVPFEKLVEALQPERSLSHTPLFQTMLALQNVPMSELRLPDLALKPVEAESPIAKFDLSVTLMEGPRGLTGSLEYSTELFDAGTVQRMVTHWLTLLEGAVERPDTRVSRLPLLTAPERREVLVDWNATRAPFPEACIHSLFEAQVRRAPEAVAAVFEGTQLTYARLDARANQLAHALRRRGVGPEVRVALSVERSLDIVVGLLGILKAGGAWVPVDPLLPRERLSFMLEDSAAQVLVTWQGLVDRFPEGLREHALCLDTEHGALAEEPTDAPGTGVTPANMAYLLYTSGSTGTPKGTAVEHRGVANLVTHEALAYGIGPGSRVLQFASLSFDLSVEEVFTTLCNGATLVLAPLEKLMPGEPLPVLLREQQLSVVSLTPAALAATSSEELPEVRTVISGGEALPAEVVARWAPGRRLINTYGPTEATVIATFGQAVADGSVPSIGKPLANVRVYVLDPHGQPVPVGVRGELHIGGVGVARGYAGRPGLTAERFVPDAFSGVEGARLYRTGDVVRWRADGQLDFVGRTDAQVKVRGFRIELGEVETALARQPGVSEAVVLVRGDGADKRLVGYVVAKEGHALDVDTLRAGLRQRLPEYMVPSALRVLDALPLNANGKVDRKALPELEAARMGDAYVAPRTVTEAKVAAVWAEVLRLERVGVKDNFFALGGHSLLATQVVSRIRMALGVEMPLRLLFESPTVEALALRLSQLGRSGVPMLSAGARPASLPLSFAQQRLWFIDQLEPGSPLYNVPTVVRLEGDLDASALEQALHGIVRRHEALRTTFEEEAGQPVQRIHASVDVPLRLVDLGTSGAATEEEVRHRVMEEMARPFDLMRGPLLRALLVRLDARDHVLVVTMHHSVSDGWSVGVLLRELVTLYVALSRGLAASLPPLPVQYADYAAWQRDWLRDETLQREVDYWKRSLTGAPPVLELPTDRPRPAVRTNAGTTLGFMLSPELSHGLSALAQKEGVSLFMVLLAGWQVLLSRYSGQTDISVGSPIAGRTRAEVEGLIGFFVNTLVLRAQVEGDLSFRALLAQVRETVLGAYEHQDVPFEKLVEALHPERSLSHTPLFQSLMSLQNVPMDEAQLPGLVLKPLALEGRTSKFDVSLFFTETPQGLSGSVEYSTDLFEAATVRRMVEHLKVLLEGVVAKPETAVGRLPMLTPVERQQVLVTWNQSQAEYARDATIPHLFEAQAKRTPNAVAVVSGKQRLTYREVEAKANQLAHRLRKLGVGPESRVGLCVERTADVVVGTLGILKAGGAYVPLDPSYPKERLGWLLEDAQGPALVAHSHLLESLPPFTAQAVCLDREEEWAEESCCPVAPDVRPENVAYLIYTSGSTGRPKGVAVTHRNAVAFLAWATETFTKEETKAVLAATSLNFDLSVFELFAPLVRGGSVVVVRNALHLAEEKPEAEVTLINTVPSAMAQLVRLGAVPPSVQVINLAGEALPETLAKAVYAVPTVKKLYNLYGPSEDTTYSTWSLVGRAEVPNIGRPLTNTRAYVLDKYLQPVPVGVAGELYLAGEGQARGYLLRPELTAEKFLPEVYGPAGSRMYRTGDRVRYRADGVLEYLGRVDFQVKVRGFRIELGEVESALRQQEAVKEAVVVAKGEGAEKRLVAYVAPKAGATLEAEALKASLRQRLPEYMVPGAVVVLEALPLNSNGKVDRKALPEPEAPKAGSTYEAPRTETEAKLAAIWAEVLRVPRVGVKDDFFALGGHSLLATQVVSRVRAETGAELPLRALFEAPTVESLARRLESAGRAKAPALVRVSREAPLPLSFAQQRLWFIDQLEPGTALYNVPVAVRLEGDLDVGALERALLEVVRRHEALRTTFVAGSPEPVQRAASGSAFTLVVDDLPSNTAGLQRRVEHEVLRPFELAHGPLIRALLLKLDAREHVLAVTMHHIVSDGWSLGVLIREVSTLYAAFVHGLPSSLPELPVQYADYAAWQRGWLQGTTLQREVDYWKQKLAGAPPMLELPTDRPRPAVRGNAGATQGFLWPQSLSQGLRGLAQREGASLYMVLLAGWQVLLSRYSGQTDISVGSPIAGRTRAEVEGLIGFFVNTLVLRAQVEGDQSFRALLAQVRETVLGAYEHQDVPFEKLVEALQPERSLSHTPLFQSLMSLQNVPLEESRLPGLVLKPVDFEGRTSKFDVSLFFTETPQGLSGSVEYSTDLFEAATVRRMVEHLRMLLEGVVAKPEEAVGRLPLLTEAERQQVLVTWNQSQVEYAREATIPQLFEAQVKRTPEAVAVVSGKQHLTYREVEAKANQLAHRLRKLGVGPESRVGLCVERTADVVVGTLGILKAGGAYVPLDPSYPKERLGWLLEDAQGPALVAHSHLLESLPPFSAQAVCLDREEEWAEESCCPVTSEVRPENVAYLIYTSGSTGRPKGVAVTHRNAVAFLAWATETFTEEETKAVLAATSLNFDLSVFELFAPLVRGGSVVVVRNALHLLEEKPEAEVTLINTVPSAMAQLVRLNAVPPSVRVVNLAGEALPETLAKAVYAVPTVKKLYNLYGPSEDTTYSTWSLVGRAEVPNIGRPLTNTRAYVLDRYLQPVPVGVAGELYLAGEGQARGYLLRPELTAEKFLPEVYGPAGSRMYRTGDRVRYRADGVLEYLGRVDFQVKVRGFRIELGEVEAALRQQEAVKEAVVVAKGEGAEKRLVAYVAPKAGKTLESEALRASLRQRLPEYMVPGAVVVLEALPLNSNGKVDRKALPEPDVSAAHTENFVAPRDALESQLVAVWEEVLGVQPISVRTSFFALGGHSLLAVRMVAELRERLGREVPLAALFQHPTVEELAKLLRDEAGAWSPLVPLEKGEPGRRPLFLVHPGGGNVLAYPELARLLGPHQPVIGIQARGLQVGQSVAETVEEMAALYVAAIRAEQSEGPYLLAGWSLGGVIAFEMARQLRAQGQAVGLLALVDAFVPGVQQPSSEAPKKDPDAGVRVAFAQTVAQAFSLTLPVTDEALERMDDDAMLGTLLAVGVQAGLLEEATGREQLRALFRVYQANLRAMDRYTPGPYEGPALLLAATEATPTPGVPRHRSWEPWVRGGLDVRDVPGGHHQLMQEPYVRHVATLLREALEDKS